MSPSPTAPPAPEGPRSVFGAPHLPKVFTGTFTSRYTDTEELRQHAVTGGDGPPLLLVHGWPQSWYAWRMLMPALARQFHVIAPDQRGTGLSGNPPRLRRRHPGRRPRGSARQLRGLPRARHHHWAERAAQDPPTVPSHPGDRRSRRHRCRRRGHDEARRGRRAERCHSRHRPLLPRGGSRRDAGRADRIPGPYRRPA
jgi:hypothetical protein